MRSAKIAPIAFLLVACANGMLPGQGARVEGVLDAQSLTAARGTLRVAVAGTALATNTDASGRFAFDNVPPGNGTLHFTGNGIDAAVAISGLKAGQTLQVTVRLSGKEGEATPPPPAMIHLTGSVAAVGTQSITVSGIEVDTDANTKLVQNDAAIQFSDLKVGDIVRVDGALQDGGKVLASRIDRLVPKDLNQVSFAGAIGTIAAPNFTVSGLTIVTDANTRFEGQAHALDGLVVGDQVKVAGTLQADGSVLASKVVKGDEDEDDDEAVLHGAIATITPPDTFTVGTTTVVVNASTRIEGQGGDGDDHEGDDKMLSFSDLKVGDQVQVEGVAQADGSVLATKIEVGAEHD